MFIVDLSPSHLRRGILLSLLHSKECLFGGYTLAHFKLTLSGLVQWYFWAPHLILNLYSGRLQNCLFWVNKEWFTPATKEGGAAVLTACQYVNVLTLLLLWLPVPRTKPQPKISLQWNLTVKIFSCALLAKWDVTCGAYMRKRERANACIKDTLNTRESTFARSC